ncbi:exosome complex exonuclease Rrp41 [Candidatus Woesearchaeota archaeon]|nr:exosome complex exonuclease Rrp41 [Candidatus Woesearchaeota archaeon]
MSYNKRNDGRGFDDLRPMEAKAGVVKSASGSAYFKIGKTVAYATVHGPRDLYPKFLKDPKKGKIRVFYQMMPFSGVGGRIRPGPNRRAKEISLVTEKAFEDVVCLDRFPNAVVDIFIDIPQADAGTRCAGISAASIALADAGIAMKEMVSGVAVGRVSDRLVVDLDYSEEAHEEGATDMPVAVTSVTNRISLLQMDGDFDKNHMREILEKAVEAGKKINEVQVKALKEEYGVENDGNE